MITAKIKIQENEEKGTCEVTLVGIPKKDYEKGTPAEKTTANVLYSEIQELLNRLKNS